MVVEIGCHFYEGGMFDVRLGMSKESVSNPGLISNG